MSNVNYKCVSGSRMGQWQKLAEEHAANGVSFMVRPFNKQVHWAFLEDVCRRYNLVARFNAVDKSAFFDPRSKTT